METLISNNYSLKRASQDSHRAIRRYRILKCMRLRLKLPNAITLTSPLLAIIAVHAALT